MTIRDNETTTLLEEGKKGKQSTVSHRGGNNVTPSSSSSILRFTGFLLSCVVLVHYVHLVFSSGGVSTSTSSLTSSSSIATSDITNHVDVVSVVDELDNDQDLDQLIRGFFDPSVSLAGDADEVYFGDEVVDVDQVVVSRSRPPDPFWVWFRCGGCNNATTTKIL